MLIIITTLDAVPGCMSAIFIGWIIRATKIEEKPMRGYPIPITQSIPIPRISCPISKGR